MVVLANVVRDYYTSLQRSENLGYLVSRDEYRLSAQVVDFIHIIFHATFETAYASRSK